MKHAINKTKMRPGPKIEHRHMKAVLCKILWVYSQNQNKLYSRPKRSSNKIHILQTKFELGKNEFNIPNVHSRWHEWVTL